MDNAPPCPFRKVVVFGPPQSGERPSRLITELLLSHRECSLSPVTSTRISLDASKANLEHQRFSVLEAANGPEGIDQVEGYQPDLVVLDLMMPLKDGWWFLREVQKCPAPRPVVMVLSARADQAERLLAQSLGAAAYMTKPFDPKKVVRKVQSLIGPAFEGRALG